MRVKHLEYYHRVISPIEPPEFIEWFDNWYGEQDEYDNHPDFLPEYYNERRFALMGWLANQTDKVIRLDTAKFMNEIGYTKELRKYRPELFEDEAA